MNVQKLNIILEALKYGSMTKAAEKLGYTQSALTYAIKSPECQPGSLLSSEENKIKKAAETAFLKPNLCEQAVSRVLSGTFVPG